MKRFWEMGGVIAGVLLVAFGIGAIVIGFTGRSEVQSNIQREAIVGSPDMTPTAIKSEAAKAGLKNVDLPTCSVADEAITTGTEAKCFASYMRIHALEATGGLTYAQMGRFLDANGNADERRGEGRGRSEDEAAGREPRPQHLGDRDRVDDGAQHVVLRGAGRDVQHRHGLRAPVDGDRVPRPRLARRAEGAPDQEGTGSDGDPHRLTLSASRSRRRPVPATRGGPFLCGELGERPRCGRERARILEHRREEVAVLRNALERDLHREVARLECRAAARPSAAASRRARRASAARSTPTRSSCPSRSAGGRRARLRASSSATAS